jgi:hypothetical protein
MKRIPLPALLALLLVLLLTACGSAPSHPKSSPSAAAAAPAATGIGTSDCEPTGDGYMGVCNPDREQPSGLTLSRAPTATLGGIQGVDISNNNGTVSFRYLHDHGIRFVYAKAEQECFIDSEVAHNAAGAAAEHIAFGIYDFIQPGRIAPSSDAACLAARERAALSHTHTTLPVVFDAESFNGLSGSAICVWLHTAEDDLRRDLPGVLEGVYGSPGTYPGCRPNSTHGWVADWLVSFPVNLPGFSGFYNWQWFGPRFASTTLDGIDRDKGAASILSLMFPKAKPKPKPLTAPQKKATLRALAHLLGAYDKRTNPHGHNCQHPPFRHAYPSARYNDACAVWANEKRALQH